MPIAAGAGGDTAQFRLTGHGMPDEHQAAPMEGYAVAPVGGLADGHLHRGIGSKGRHVAMLSECGSLLRVRDQATDPHAITTPAPVLSLPRASSLTLPAVVRTVRDRPRGWVIPRCGIPWPGE